MNLSLRQRDLILWALYLRLGKLQKIYAFAQSEKYVALLQQEMHEHKRLIELIQSEL